MKSTLLYLGSLSVSSGHRVDLLPSIMDTVTREFPDAKLVIAGHGDDEKKLRHPRIELRGAFAAADVPRLVAMADVIIDPADTSIAQRAKSSFRVLAAATAGKPVVTSNVGIRPYLLPESLHERCFSRPADVVSYAGKIMAWLRQPITPAEAVQLQRHAKRFSWDVLAEQYLRILEL